MNIIVSKLVEHIEPGDSLVTNELAVPGIVVSTEPERGSYRIQLQGLSETFLVPGNTWVAITLPPERRLAQAAQPSVQSRRGRVAAPDPGGVPDATGASTAGATGEPSDELERRALALGVIDVDLLRLAAPELAELRGAALEKALQRTLRDERPFLAPDLTERLAARSRSTGLDGGRGHGAGASSPEPTVDDFLRGSLRQQRAERDTWVDTARRERELR